MRQDFVDVQDKAVKSKIIGNRIECGVCGSLLMKKIYPHGFEHVTGETGSEFMKQQRPRFIRKVESEPYHFEIKCKHRKNGIFCNAVNLVHL